jgi:hypothetical protein
VYVSCSALVSAFSFASVWFSGVSGTLNPEAMNMLLFYDSDVNVQFVI